MRQRVKNVGQRPTVCINSVGQWDRHGTALSHDLSIQKAFNNIGKYVKGGFMGQITLSLHIFVSHLLVLPILPLFASNTCPTSHVSHAPHFGCSGDKNPAPLFGLLGKKGESRGKL